MPDIKMGPASPPGWTPGATPTSEWTHPAPVGDGSGSGGASSGSSGVYKPITVTGTGPEAAQSLAQQASGRPYDYGGTGSQGRSFDCSGLMSSLYGAYTGQDTTKRYFSTMGPTSGGGGFPALGFQPGYQPGAFNIGVNPQPGTSGHMAGTLPNGINVESNGSKGVQYGGSAAGATNPQFSQQWHLPVTSDTTTTTSGAPGVT